jgi:hypothetical protein
VTFFLMGFVLAWFAQLDVGGLGGPLTAYRVLWPQNWSFFTHLNEDQIVAYRVLPGTPRLRSLTDRQTWVEHQGGLNRIGHAQALEVREIARRIPDRYWQVCERDSTADCENDLDESLLYRVERRVSASKLCGSMAIAVERAVLPAPRRLPETPRRLYRIALVDLRC